MTSLHYDNSYTCRGCLENAKDEISLKSIYGVETISNASIKLCTILNYCTNMDVYEGDGLPETICQQCADDAVKAFTFKQQFIRANAILRDKLSSYMIKEANGIAPSTSLTFEHVFVKQEEPLIIENVVDIADYDDIAGGCSNANVDDIAGDSNNLDNHDNSTHVADEAQLIEKKIKISEKLKSMLTDDNGKTEITNRAISSYIRELKRKPKQTHVHTCEICSKTLSTAGSLKTHMLTHSGTSQFLCSICGEGFKTKSSYEDHLAGHDPNNPYKCVECGKSYKNQRSLKEHIVRSHSSVKPFVCGVCGKGCTQKVGLQKHMMIHTGEKPFECDICGKNFRYKNVLVLHKRYHTGERPFSCSECGQTFIGRSHYRTHLLIHTGVKPFECDICGKCFNRRTNLRCHRKIHTGEREHICSICGKGFIQNNCLRAHMLTHERDKEVDKGLLVPQVVESSS